MRMLLRVGIVLLLALCAAALFGQLQPSQAAFPGANGKIAFTSERDSSGIYVMNADGSAPTRLTNNIDYGPAWSATGAKIAFNSFRDGNHEIYVMNADGSAQTRLTNNSAGDYSAAWSPDGMKIAFASDRDGNPEIYVMNVDGSAPTRLTNNMALDYAPNWSPDGTKIAFTSGRDGNSEIYVMNADGSAQTRLTNNTTATDDSADWSPDGTQIVFVSNRAGPGSYGPSIYVMNANGSGTTRLTNRLTEEGSDYSAQWSPDGTKITFHSDRGGTPLQVWAMNADGSAMTNLTNDSSQNYGPDWQPIAPFPPSQLVDTDLDGCTDKRELQTAPGSEISGGGRNPKYFWDFYDVWTHPIGNPSGWERNKLIDLFEDIFGVAARFGAERLTPPTKPQALAEALVVPTSDAGYHADFDRGPQIGANSWNIGGPDGTIDLFNDIFGAAFQFGHDCS